LAVDERAIAIKNSEFFGRRHHALFVT
jgi:hypothetical protein